MRGKPNSAEGCSSSIRKRTLRPEVEERLREVQDNLGDHNFSIAMFYRDRYNGKKGGSRLAGPAERDRR
jgi:hypothetical protein